MSHGKIKSSTQSSNKLTNKYYIALVDEKAKKISGKTIDIFTVKNSEKPGPKAINLVSGTSSLNDLWLNFGHKRSPDGSKIAFYVMDENTHITKLSVFNASDMELIYEKDIKVSNDELKKLAKSKLERYKTDITIDNSGNVYALLSGLASRIDGAFDVQIYTSISADEDEVVFKDIIHNKEELSDAKIIATDSGVYHTMFYNSENGFAVRKFMDGSFELKMDYTFTTNDFYLLDNPYSLTPSNKEGKNRIKVMKIVNILEKDNNLVLVTEQHTYGQGNGYISDMAKDITLFVINANELNRIVNIPKSGMNSAASDLSCAAMINDDKIYIVSGSDQKTPLDIYNFDLATNKLSVKTFEEDSNGDKIKGDIRFNSVALNGPYFCGPIVHAMKGLKKTIIKVY